MALQELSMLLSRALFAGTWKYPILVNFTMPFARPFWLVSVDKYPLFESIDSKIKIFNNYSQHCLIHSHVSGASTGHHYSDVIMSAMASQITGVSMVCSTVCSIWWRHDWWSSLALTMTGNKYYQVLWNSRKLLRMMLCQFVSNNEVFWIWMINWLLCINISNDNEVFMIHLPNLQHYSDVL